MTFDLNIWHNVHLAHARKYILTVSRIVACKEYSLCLDRNSPKVFSCTSIVIIFGKSIM